MYPRWLWPSFALPGAAWLVLLFLVPTYAVLAVAFGTVDPIFSNPVPVWNPLHWSVRHDAASVLRRAAAGQPFWTVFVRTFAYVGLSLAGCLPIGYPVAYYLARHARPHEDAAARPPDRAVLGQLPDADARLGRPAPP